MVLCVSVVALRLSRRNSNVSSTKHVATSQLPLRKQGAAPKSPKADPLPPPVPTAAPAATNPAADAANKALTEMVVAMQKEIAAMREHQQELPTAGQFEKLQLQLRTATKEMGEMREKMAQMQRQINEIDSRNSEVPLANNTSPPYTRSAYTGQQASPPQACPPRLMLFDSS